MKHSLQILAPAGDMDMLRAAVFSGADCVYLGLRGFNARRTAANFDAEELAAAVAFCHARGCRVHAAVNTLVLPGREAQMEEAVCAVRNAGCDAVIVQDLAVLKAVKRLAPQLPVHASTQTSVHSLAGVRQLAKLGFSCAILARELREEEIADIAAEAPIDVEVFVHGALCVSVSGQCYASAFLGGRSANRGACAGPCRLPFEAMTADVWEKRKQQAGKAKEGCYDLSLKDLSILDALPRLEEIGVASVKIEGRLRGPEYVAVAVDSARKALDGQPYDKQLLQEVFSRSGFTDAWFGGKQGVEMLGVRTEADAAAAKRALPKARELYRRERPRVPVHMRLVLQKDGARLTVEDGENTVQKSLKAALPPAQNDMEQPLREALAKTGGTPFYCKEEPEVQANGLFLAAGQAAALRRDVLQELLARRGQAAAPVAKCTAEAPTGEELPPAEENAWKLVAQGTKKKTGRAALRARFESLNQMPDNAAALCDVLLLPVGQAQQVPEVLRAKTFLWLPRAMFGAREAALQQQVDAVRGMGFAGLEVNNLAHVDLCEGFVLSAGFGMNLANVAAVRAMAGQGAAVVTLSAELSFAQMRDVAADGFVKGHVATDAVGYGHFPLMMTRACPLQKGQSCAECEQKGMLLDRKGQAFPLQCKHGVRQVYNPVALWQAERLHDWPCDYATLYFTGESRQQAEDVLQAFAGGKPAPGAFTRGLYTSGTEDG